MRKFFLFACLLGTLPLAAHYTWVASVTPFEAGKTVEIRIGHGHRFPKSEEAINARQVELTAIAPSGVRTKLEPAVTPGAVMASYTVKDPGLHRLMLVQDRGVTSRTPKGVRPGGRDKNPDAVLASRTMRTAVAYLATPHTKSEAPKPLGLEIELVGERKGGSWSVQLLKQGKPLEGVEVSMFLAGATATAPAGKTGSDGRASFPVPAGKQAMFAVEFKDKAPAGAMYDAVNYESSLMVNW